MRPRLLIVTAFALVLLSDLGPLGAEVPRETVGQVETLAQPFHAHWVWVADLVLQRAALVDLDDGRFLGLINGGFGTIMPLFPSRRSEVYVPATYYARFTHG